MSILVELQTRCRTALAEYTDEPEPYLEMIRASQDARFGDFQANFAMPLAKRRGENPRELAAQIAQRLDVADFCDEPEVAGPGFINLRLQDHWIAEAAQAQARDERLGIGTVTDPRRIVVDFSSPNVAKPMHVGHLRSTVIGDVICRLLRFVGHEVISDNHIGDWGTQFGMIIFGYRNFADADALATDAVSELARLYKLVNKLSDYHALVAALPNLQERLDRSKERLAELEAAGATDKRTKQALKKSRAEVDGLGEKIKESRKKVDAVEGSPQLRELADAHPDIAARCREETARLHRGDTDNVDLWNELLPACLETLQVVYDRLTIEFDETLGESYYQPVLAEVVSALEERGLASESDGAACVFVEGNAAPFIVRKADGAFTYATTDLATIRHRVDTMQADEILYVVDARQSEHFRLLFATAEQWGYTDTVFRHLSFGTITGPDGKPIKTRDGDSVELNSILDEAVARARSIVDENDDSRLPEPILDEEARRQIAGIVGIGGVKYFDLLHNRESDYMFDWEQMLARTGNSSTYMQYAYARIRGIFRRAGVAAEQIRGEASVQVTAPAERSLMLQLLQFDDAITAALTDYRPHLLTAYLFELANRFSSFYDECPVAKEPDEAIRASRLLLCDLTARVLQRGLALLGIETAESM